jgi:hypothetical protein
MVQVQTCDCTSLEEHLMCAHYVLPFLKELSILVKTYLGVIISIYWLQTTIEVLLNVTNKWCILPIVYAVKWTNDR